jgi:hypothetical protein
LMRAAATLSLPPRLECRRGPLLFLHRRSHDASGECGMLASPVLAPAALSLILWTSSSSCAQPFQTSTGSLTNALNPSGFGLTLTTVPAGKLLVIEFLSAACSPTGAGGVVPNPLRVTTQVDHSIALAPGSTVGQAVATHLTRIYADPGTKVNLTLFPTTNPAIVSCNVAISGTVSPKK